MPLQVQSVGSRKVALVAGSILALAIAYTRPAIRQSLDYHCFADDRTFFGVPNALNVLSNIPFLLVGIAGLIACHTSRRTVHYTAQVERWCFPAFFLGVGLTSLGSGFYHHAPSNERLLWDRLPMAIAFMGLFAAIIAERVDLRFGLSLLVPLLVLGLGSVVYWNWSDDLRFYYLVQYYPMVAIPLMLLFFPGRYTLTAIWFVVLGFYALAKVCEEFDRAIYEKMRHFVSGHTLKHFLAAAATICVLWIFVTRRPTSSAENFD
jgi:hypothetical protein